MTQTTSQRHLDLLNRIASSPPPIDASRMVTKLRRPSLEDLLGERDTKSSHRASLTGIYVRNELGPGYKYHDFAGRPISPTAIQQTMASLGLTMELGKLTYGNMGGKGVEHSQSESTGPITPGEALIAPIAVRPPKPSRPLPFIEGPYPGHMTIESEDGYESDGEEILYMLDDYIARQNAANALAPVIPISVTPEIVPDANDINTVTVDSTQLIDPAGITETKNHLLDENSQGASSGIEERGTAGTTTSDLTNSAVGDTTDQTQHIPAKEPSRSLRRINKRVRGALRLQATEHPISASEEGAATTSTLEDCVSGERVSTPKDSLPARPTRSSSKNVSFAHQADNERRESISSAKDNCLDDAHLTTPVLPTPTIEIFEVDFTELDATNITMACDNCSVKGGKKKKNHFGVYKVIRRALKRSSGDQKVDKPIAIISEPARSNTPTPSVATTTIVKPNVLRKSDPAARSKSRSGSIYSMSMATETASQKPKRSWSIKSGKREAMADDEDFISDINSAPLAPPPMLGMRETRRRSASFSGFSSIAAPAWNDPLDMEQLLKEASERLQGNPNRDWIYRPKVTPILEEGENPIAMGFVLERHVATNA